MLFFSIFIKSRRGCNRMVVASTTTYAISVYHHQSCEFEPRSWRGVLDTTLCDKVYQRRATGRWFSPGTLVSSTNKTDRHDITEILLKVALNTIILTLRTKRIPNNTVRQIKIIFGTEYLTLIKPSTTIPVDYFVSTNE